MVADRSSPPIGRIIRGLREAKGMSQEQVARKIGKTRQLLAKDQSDPDDKIPVYLLRRIADALDCSVLDFFPDLVPGKKESFDRSFRGILNWMRAMFGDAHGEIAVAGDSVTDGLAETVTLLVTEYVKARDRELAGAQRDTGRQGRADSIKGR